MDYRAWTVGTAYRAPTPDVLASLDAYLAACRARGIHLSINLHRAPGYCITGQELEVHDLWHDAVAQAGFVRIWTGSPRTSSASRRTRYRSTCSTSRRQLGLRGFTRELHEALIRRTVARGAGDRPRPAARHRRPRRRQPRDARAGGPRPDPLRSRLCAVSGHPLGRGLVAGLARGRRAALAGRRLRGSRWDRDDLRAFYEPWRAVERRERRSTSASSAATTRRPTRMPCAGSATCWSCSASSVGLRAVAVRGPVRDRRARPGGRAVRAAGRLSRRRRAARPAGRHPIGAALARSQARLSRASDDRPRAACACAPFGPSRIQRSGMKTKIVAVLVLGAVGIGAIWVSMGGLPASAASTTRTSPRRRPRRRHR